MGLTEKCRGGEKENTVLYHKANSMSLHSKEEVVVGMLSY